ncbi:diguanylate cyclase domain-containing protein [Blastococcus sp. VKM Ac-2987]|uniref:diguanylate cyclase domain-containing protein n=1 Tax=Blastococcus sp. VKM Ac-2987 TaxID=3004141 RepID=UPI0022ABAA4E|nr:diguanylate cyclase [Blastococcus sp. VKM Ac-2987]MCZ2858584.1 diguanylate cyclase [Blastococcus sp. VKM Ac-2987]
MDADPELDGLVRVAAAIPGLRYATVITMDSPVLRAISLHGRSPVSWPRDASVSAVLAARGPGVHTVDDLSAEPEFAFSAWVDGSRARLRGFAYAPVVQDGATVAALVVFDDEPHRFTADERDRLADLAALVASLFRARRQARELADLAAATQIAHQELARSAAFTRALLEVLPVGVVGGDRDGRVALFNAASRRWHGIDADPAIAPADFPASFRLTDPDGRTLLPSEVPLTRVHAEGRIDDVEIGIDGPEGLRRVASSGVQVRDDAGELLGAVVTLSDVTAQRALEDALREAALHDPLTGLPNRNLLLDRLEQTLAAAGRARQAMAVLYCDLDGFKPVNDTAGHAAGDEVLVDAARRLAASVRPGDTVARIGGDEFVVLCPEVGSERAAQVIADRIAGAFGAPLRRSSGDEHQVGISIGITMCSPEDTADSALAAADAAMYRVKAARRSGRVPGPRAPGETAATSDVGCG